ncbi:MAG: glycerophosphodiester phosphodiesterase family protein, partial [Kiloniellales bacterium]
MRAFETDTIGPNAGRRGTRKRLLVVLALAFGLGAAGSAGGVEIQGHRGARGLAPENTLAGFALALSIGVTTLELDVGVTADGVVVVAHDPRLNPALARTADGSWLAAPGPPLSSLTLAELRRYDVGRIDPQSRYARRFPDQRPVDGARIPMLAEVVALSRKAGNHTVRFNIETKLG